MSTFSSSLWDSGVWATPAGSAIRELCARLGGIGVAVDPMDGGTVYTSTDAAALATLNGTVARIDSSAGIAASFTNATAGQQPLLRANWLEFDGVDDVLSYPDNTALRFGTTDFTIAFACKSDNTTTTGHILSKRGPAVGGTLAGWGVRQSAVDLILEFDPGVGTPANFFVLKPSAFASGVSVYGLIVINRTANTALARINGVDGTPVTIPPGDISGTLPLMIGKAANGIAQFFDGNIGRLLVINKLLNPADTATVEQWLQNLI